jgi:hypothetical protein
MALGVAAMSLVACFVLVVGCAHSRPPGLQPDERMRS